MAVNKNQPISNTNTQEGLETVGEFVSNPVLSEYLLALIEVKRIVEGSGATDINSLRAYIKGHADKLNSSAVKSILEREMNGISRSPELSGNITSFQQYISDTIEDVKALDNVVNRMTVEDFSVLRATDMLPQSRDNHKEVVNPRVEQIVGQIVDSIVVTQGGDQPKEREKPKRLNQEQGNNPLVVYGLPEISEAIKAMHLEDQKAVQQESAVQQENVAVDEQAISRDTKVDVAGEVDLRGVDFGDESLGDDVVINRGVDDTGVELTKANDNSSSREIIDGELISKVNEEQDLERVKKQNADAQIYADIIIDAEREEEAESEMEERAEIDLSVIESIAADMEKEVLEVGAEFVRAGTTMAEDDTVNSHIEEPDATSALNQGEEKGAGRER